LVFLSYMSPLDGSNPTATSKRSTVVSFASCCGEEAQTGDPRELTSKRQQGSVAGSGFSHKFSARQRGRRRTIMGPGSLANHKICETKRISTPFELINFIKSCFVKTSALTVSKPVSRHVRAHCHTFGADHTSRSRHHHRSVTRIAINALPPGPIAPQPSWRPALVQYNGNCGACHHKFIVLYGVTRERPRTYISARPHAAVWHSHLRPGATLTAPASPPSPRDNIVADRQQNRHPFVPPPSRAPRVPNLDLRR
jgi:hypothetical protein